MNRLIYPGIIILIALFFIACGKKADPELPMQVAPNSARKLRAVVRPDSIILFWQAPKENTNESPLIDLGGFRVFREEMPFEDVCLGCPRNFIEIYNYDYPGLAGQVPGKKILTYYDWDLKPKTLYNYKIDCYNKNDIAGPPSRMVNVYYDSPPEPPSAVRVTRKQRLLVFEWEPPALYEDGTAVAGTDRLGFNIYRAGKPGDHEQLPLNNELLQEPVFEDIPEKIDSSYYYAVRAVRSINGTLIESAPSREVVVSYMDTKAPGVPQALTVIPVKAGVLLKWMPKTERDFAGFNLYRKTPRDETFTKLNDKLIVENSWVDETAKLRRRYIYGVTSVDRSAGKNESRMSETVEVLYIIK